MESFHKEVDHLEECMKKLKTPLAVSFCHNDLLIENFIHDEYEGRLTIIVEVEQVQNFVEDKNKNFKNTRDI